MAKKEKQKKFSDAYKWLIGLITVFFVLIIIFTAGEYFYAQAYAKTFFPGVKIGKEKLSGKNYLDALKILEAYIDTINQDGYQLVYNDKKIIITPSITSASDPDLSYDILTFDKEKTLDNAFNLGKGKDWFGNIKEQLLALFRQNPVYLSYELNELETTKILKENLAQFENPAADSQLIFEKDIPSATQEKNGQVFNYARLINDLNYQMKNLQQESITPTLIADYPKIKKENITTALQKVSEILVLTPLTIKYEDKNWAVDKEKLKKWLGFKFKNNQVGLGLKTDSLTEYLGTLGKEVNVEAKEGKFEMKDGKVSEFQASQNGKTIDIAKTIIDFEEKLIANKNNELTLVISETKPAVTTSTINEMGIKELIGRGESDFKGSPKNRIYNIKRGAEILHGLLIKPDEEFSLVKALGKIEAATGFLPELVIKGNKTIPEYGGGLCQIGTTTFRVALYTGLPILERTPHSYRVSYYEPAGMDATIYDPKPDFKFINDMGHYILFQTKIEGTKLIFEFYGISDGRKIEITKPRIFNYVKPGPSKIIETEDLAPGEKKCTEKAHTGADAEFTSTVSYADGEVKKTVWKSHYKPWQEVCLLGIEKKNP
jgi:vancomycin resistance protein YoaR